MTDTPFLDHRAIRKLAEQCPKLDALLAQREIFEAIDPITPAMVDDDAPQDTMGYFATSDGRIAFRLVGQQEAQAVFGVDACTMREAFLVTDRITRIGEIEDAGMQAQARAVKLLDACKKLFAAQQGVGTVSAKDMIKIGSLLHEIEAQDQANAPKIAEMKARNEQANRDRKWALKKAGIAA